MSQKTIINRYELITLIIIDKLVEPNSTLGKMMRDDFSKASESELVKHSKFFIQFDKGRYTTFSEQVNK
jgi:hypothetical protein